MVEAALRRILFFFDEKIFALISEITHALQYIYRSITY